MDLNSKIFTFSKKLSLADLTKMTDENTTTQDELEIEQLSAIKKLKCMRDIDNEFLPSFKFFQFKKSIIEIKGQGSMLEEES